MKSLFKYSGIICAILVTTVPLMTIAATSSGVGDGGGILQNPLKYGNIQELITGILTVVARVGAIVVVFFVIYSGFLFVTAQGKPEKIEDAKKAFFWTIVGALILLGAVAVSELIKNTVGGITGGRTSF